MELKTEAAVLEEIASLNATITLLDQERHAYTPPYWKHLLQGLLHGDVECIRQESRHVRRPQLRLKKTQTRLEALLDWRSQPVPGSVTRNELGTMRYSHIWLFGRDAQAVRQEFGPMRDDVLAFLVHRDGRRCVRCHSPHNLEVDHIVPVSLGGGNYTMNFQVLCFDCNHWKRDRVWFPGLPRLCTVRGLRP